MFYTHSNSQSHLDVSCNVHFIPSYDKLLTLERPHPPKLLRVNCYNNVDVPSVTKQHLCRNMTLVHYIAYDSSNSHDLVFFL